MGGATELNFLTVSSIAGLNRSEHCLPIPVPFPDECPPQSRVRVKHYQSSSALDKDMSLLFMKSRRWYEPGSEAYGNVLLLQVTLFYLYHVVRLITGCSAFTKLLLPPILLRALPSYHLPILQLFQQDLERQGLSIAASLKVSLALQPSESLPKIANL